MSGIGSRQASCCHGRTHVIDHLIPHLYGTLAGVGGIIIQVWFAKIPAGFGINDIAAVVSTRVLV